MEKFALKIGKELRCYELDEDKKQLHITVQKRRKVTWKQNVDLQNVYANFYESAPEKTPVFKQKASEIKYFKREKTGGE